MARSAHSPIPPPCPRPLPLPFPGPQPSSHVTPEPESDPVSPAVAGKALTKGPQNETLNQGQGQVPWLGLTSQRDQLPSTSRVRDPDEVKRGHSRGTLSPLQPPSCSHLRPTTEGSGQAAGSLVRSTLVKPPTPSHIPTSGVHTEDSCSWAGPQPGRGAGSLLQAPPSLLTRPGGRPPLLSPRDGEEKSHLPSGLPARKAGVSPAPAPQACSLHLGLGLGREAPSSLVLQVREGDSRPASSASARLGLAWLSVLDTSLLCVGREALSGPPDPGSLPRRLQWGPRAGPPPSEACRGLGARGGAGRRPGELLQRRHWQVSHPSLAASVLRVPAPGPPVRMLWGPPGEVLRPHQEPQDAALADTLTVASGDPGPGLSHEAAPRPLTHRNCEMTKIPTPPRAIFVSGSGGLGGPWERKTQQLYPQLEGRVQQPPAPWGPGRMQEGLGCEVRLPQDLSEVFSQVQAPPSCHPGLVAGPEPGRMSAGLRGLHGPGTQMLSVGDPHRSLTTQHLGRSGSGGLMKEGQAGLGPRIAGAGPPRGQHQPGPQRLMGPAALGTSVESPPRSPGPGFFGDSAVRAVTKQSQLLQSLGPSTEEAAGSPGVAGQRLSAQLKPTDLPPDDCPDPTSILSRLDSTAVIDANEGDTETLLGPLSLPRPQLGANQRSWPGCPLREPPAPEAYTPEPHAAPKPTAHPAPGRSRPCCGDTHLKDSEEAPSASPSGSPRPTDQEGEEAGPLGGGPQVLRARRLQRGPGDPALLLDFTPTLSCHSWLLAVPGESQEPGTSLGETRGSLGDSTGARERAFLCLNFLIKRLSLWGVNCPPTHPGEDKVLAGVGQRCLTLAVGAGLCVARLREGRGRQGERRPGARGAAIPPTLRGLTKSRGGGRAGSENEPHQPGAHQQETAEHGPRQCGRQRELGLGRHVDGPVPTAAGHRVTQARPEVGSGCWRQAAREGAHVGIACTVACDSQPPPKQEVSGSARLGTPHRPPSHASRSQSSHLLPLGCLGTPFF
ncbi:collagen alpha-1(I) chain-like [Eubalaena glacialis]|uniref:collagen alpha-1(I) chain-like n=1 Tax=Eubalaena glacialis TaxID=27606 RepID=UPI002A59BF4B|nr:collagen alpha-1(I) chain-like [Eubalaena glacialis]